MDHQHPTGALPDSITQPVYGQAAEKLRKHLAATADVRCLLEAVLDAIDLPHGATSADNTDRAFLLDQRAQLAVQVARAALTEDPADLGWNADYIRSRLTADGQAGR